MRKRKTFEIDKLTQQVNDRNRKSTCGADMREGWNGLLESVLMDAGRYEGFRYLRRDEVPAGHSAGIIPNIKSNGDWKTSGHIYPDPSRRAYNIR